MRTAFVFPESTFRSSSGAYSLLFLFRTKICRHAGWSKAYGNNGGPLSINFHGMDDPSVSVSIEMWLRRRWDLRTYTSGLIKGNNFLCPSRDCRLFEQKSYTPERHDERMCERDFRSFPISSCRTPGYVKHYSPDRTGIKGKACLQTIALLFESSKIISRISWPHANGALANIIKSFSNWWSCFFDLCSTIASGFPRDSKRDYALHLSSS